MATHNDQTHPEPRSLKDNPEFQELAGLMSGMAPDRREAAFAEIPPALKIAQHATEEESQHDDDEPADSAGRTPARD